MQIIQKFGRIEKIGKYNELTLPIAHYALVNSQYGGHSRPKIVIYGLGSCIGLILYEKKNKVYGMSHILLPTPKINNPEIKIKFHHKFADRSVVALLTELLDHGAKKNLIKAIVIGGARIFENLYNDISTRNIKMVKKFLKSLHIAIEREETGGTKGRTVFLDTNTNSILIKPLGGKDFTIQF